MTRYIRPIRIEGNIAYVTLTKGYEAVIDAADVHLVEGRNWTADISSRTVYAYSTDLTGPKRRKVYMHRLLKGEPLGLQVDHKDSDGLNNRQDNLREATHSQNCHNSRLPVHNTSGYKGVCWHKQRGKWLASININGRKKSLGLFKTAEDAYDAYCKASDNLRGEFSRLA
jgi:hypothetical protein